MSELTDVAVEIKTKFRINEDAKIERSQYDAANITVEAAAVIIQEIDFGAELAPLIGVTPAYGEAAAKASVDLAAVVATPPPLLSPELRSRLQRFQSLTHAPTQRKHEATSCWRRFRRIDAD